MPIPAQFQLGLELTNIVNPLSQAISTVGSLAVIDAVRKAGSDTITELKLASLIGRHRVDEVMKWHFKEQVAKSDQSIISRYLDIVLESGAGPTVREALKNPALFSMVIQLSALAFSHEEESLANAIVEAIEKIVKESGKDLDMVPDYVSLLGTIRACREQTVAFSWAPIFEAVEWKLWRATQTVEEENSALPTPNRNLDFPVLQSFIMWINSLQSFPEHRMLHLRCRDGISTVVVWSHHILGLTVTVAQGKTQTQFGNGPSHIFIECYVDEPGACLMDPSAPYEPLFNLVNDLQDPPILQDPRCEAYGYGRRVLGAMQPKVSDVVSHSTKIIALCLNIARINRQTSLGRGSQKCLSDEDIIRTSKFIFAMNSIEIHDIEPFTQSPGEPISDSQDSVALMCIIISLSRVHCNDLEECKNMPLAMNMKMLYDRLDKPMGGPVVEVMCLTACFEMICCLALGHRYPLDYAKPAVLVSAWGWSVFLGGVDASDPTDPALMTIRVIHGVPSRRGTRRPRIIDGPTSSLMCESIKLAPPFAHVQNVHDICTAKMRLPMVGFHSDAFQAVRVFDWNDGKGHCREARIGFRLMQEMCQASVLLPACPHDNINNFKAWLSKSRNLQTLKLKLDDGDDATIVEPPKAPSSYLAMNLTMLYGSLGTRLEDSSDMVFVAHKEHLATDKNSYTACYYTDPGPAARWLQLCTLCQGGPETWGIIFIRSDETCYACALEAHFLEKPGFRDQKYKINSSVIL